MLGKEGAYPRVVVVGAGIVGASIAVHLTLRGAQVTIIDAGEPGQGSTKVSFAWLNAYSKSPFHYHDLNRRSLGMWSSWARRIEHPITITWGGELRWALTNEGATTLVTRARELQTWGYPTRILNARELKELEPNLPIGSMKTASFSHLEGHVDAVQATQACLARAQSLGAELMVNSPVSAWELDKTSFGRQQVEGVHVGETLISCDVVVLACGADTSDLADRAGVTLPLYHTSGITLVTEPIPPLFHSIAVLHSPRDRNPLVNFRQFPDGSVMIQSNSTERRDAGDRGQTAGEITQILEEATELLPALNRAEVREVRRGRRPIPENGEPIIGFTDALPNLYLATTHSGVTLAPIIGELAAIEIVNRVEVAWLEPFRLRRFQQKTGKR